MDVCGASASGVPVSFRRRLLWKIPACAVDEGECWSRLESRITGRETAALFAFGRDAVAGGDEAGFLNAFDLGHAAIVDGDLDRTEAEIGDVLADDFQPVGR